MPAQNRNFTPYIGIPVGSLTTTGANDTAAICAPNGNTVALMQRNKLTATYNPSEVWRPVGCSYVITTGITVTAVVLQLMKNGVAPNGPSATAAANGSATLPIQALGVAALYVPFSDYTYAAADAAGDYWSLHVLTTSTAGVINPVVIYYSIVSVLGLTDGVTL
jgi:hypothetical protein